MAHHNLFFGVDKHHKDLKHISEVPRGLDCNCTCPECGAEFIAKKGDILQHHFAHSHEGNYECQGHGVAMTFIHKRAQEIFKAHASRLDSQKYEGSNLTSDAAGEIDFLGWAHVEVVVTSRMKEEKLRYIKTEFDSPMKVYRCDLSREEERDLFMRYLNSPFIWPFLLGQCVEIKTAYQYVAELIHQAEFKGSQKYAVNEYHKKLAHKRLTTRQWAKDKQYTRSDLINLGQIASLMLQRRGIEKLKIREGAYTVNAFPLEILNEAAEYAFDYETRTDYRRFGS